MKGFSRGFTLIEVILAIALGGMIVLAASTMMLSFTQLWLQEGELDNLEDHVNGVTQFLQRRIDAGYYSNSTKLPDPKFEYHPDANERTEDPTLSFVVTGDHPLLEPVNTGVARCYLEIDKNYGLVLVYHSFYRKSQEDDSQELYMRVVSKWGKEIKLHYFDSRSGKWEVTDEPIDDSTPQKKKWKVPEYIEIVFKKEGEEPISSFVQLMPGFKEGGLII